MTFNASKLPNILTVIRMIFVPIIVIFILVPSWGTLYSFSTGYSSATISINFFLAGVLFLLASLTDALDGYLARRNNWISNFGKIWDPVADKVLVNSVLICFAAINLIPIWVPIIMIARDVMVDAARIDASSKSVIVPANIYGKLKTITQMIGIIVIFFVFADKEQNALWWGIQNLLILLATFLSVLSGAIYLKNIYRSRRA